MEPDDDRWSGLLGGYRTPYDPRNAIGKLAAGELAAWGELWEELHHQGDVGEASYAAVSEIVRVHEARGVPDWNTYGLAATIEEARHSEHNPPVPEWLLPDYETAWGKLQSLAISELPKADTDTLIQSIIAVLALSKGQLTLGRMAMLTEDERAEMLDGAGWG